MYGQLLAASALVAGALAQTTPMFFNTSTTTTTFTQSASSVGSPIVTSATTMTSPPVVGPGDSLQCGSLYAATANDKFLIYCNYIAQGLTFFTTVTENLIDCVDECVARGDACAAAQFDNRTAPYSCSLKRPNNEGGMMRRQAGGAGNRGTFAAIRVNAAGNPVIPASPLFPTLTFTNASTVTTTVSTNPAVEPTLNFFTSAGLICYFRSALVSNGQTVSVFPLPTA